MRPEPRVARDVPLPLAVGCQLVYLDSAIHDARRPTDRTTEEVLEDLWYEAELLLDLIREAVA
jgi:hypothetical protein